MSLDLTDLLEDWPYESGKINVRLIEGDDGSPIVQVRLDLGLLQMRSEGRPDGQRPFGYGSLLEYHEARIDAAGQGIDPDGDPVSLEDPGDSHAEEPVLTREDCRLLREEAVQYYHRYIAMLVLDDYEAVLRDTSRNLRVITLCAEHAEDEDDRHALEQFKPYVIMMRARALASQALRDDVPKAALFAVDEGLEALRSLYEEAGHPEAMDESGEARMLRGMREALLPKLPVSQAAELRTRLEEAIERENYELAAILRDELRLLSDGRPAGGLPPPPDMKPDTKPGPKPKGRGPSGA